jgi:hypothetical protein
MTENKKIEFGTGAFRDIVDIRDRLYDGIAFGAAPFDWAAGYDVEKVIGHKIPFKDQDGSLSCVGQSWAYYVGVLNAVETGVYRDVSAKALYSQIALPAGGAYLRDGAKLVVNWGAVNEDVVVSYDGGKPPAEPFMREREWLTGFDPHLARVLSAKEFRMIASISMEVVAQGIRDNFGLVGGVMGANNGSWNLLEPVPGALDWGHAVYFGKAGIDDNGKYIATPNSWGNRFNGGWQKFRENWFVDKYMFNPWLLVDQVNPIYMPQEIVDLIAANDKGMLIENDPPGRKGIIYDGKLMEVITGREGVAALYLIENKTTARRISKDQFDAIPRGNNF